MYPETGKIIFALIAGTVVFGTIVGYFIYSMIRLHRSYVFEMDRQNQAKIDALEHERKLIAADLHDDVGPILSAINIKLQEVNPTEERERQLLKGAIDHVDDVFSRMRQLSAMLVPRFLESKGPLYAIEEFAGNYGSKTSMEIKISPVQTTGLNAEKALHVFRMLQEIIHNAVKHSQAKTLKIEGEVNNGQLMIQTQDDGIGFYMDAANKSKGLGLHNLQLRARMIGATLTTDSSPGKGTRYTIQIPLDK